jgi:hypothetical protein
MHAKIDVYESGVKLLQEEHVIEHLASHQGSHCCWPNTQSCSRSSRLHLAASTSYRPEACVTVRYNFGTTEGEKERLSGS